MLKPLQIHGNMQELVDWSISVLFYVPQSPSRSFSDQAQVQPGRTGKCGWTTLSLKGTGSHRHITQHWSGGCW
ncbi:hypothetical protein MHYP_G00269080 [Metynnis hypsauchen]